MAHNRMRAFGGSKMDGPTLIYTATSQASAAGGATQYAFVSCFGAKAVQFFVRTAAGVPNLGGSLIDVDPGVGISIVTGVGATSQNISYGAGSNGDVHVAPGDISTTYANTNNRFMCDRIALRGQLAISATGVSCWATVQWD